MKIISVTLLFVVFCAVRSLWAATFMPPVTNYALREPMCCVRTWSVSQDDHGVMYFGGNSGLLTFDGAHWDLYPVAGGAVVRSVLVDGDRIYVGSYREFGYFIHDNNGALVYNSLSDDLDNFKFGDDEFWGIVKIDGDICFHSFRNWFRYNGRDVIPFQSSEYTPLYMFNYRDCLYMQLMQGPLCSVDGYDVTPINSNKIRNKIVVAMLECDSEKGILCTKENGLFWLDRNEVTRFSTEVDTELGIYNINRAVAMRDGTILLGTIRNGVYAVNREGKLLWHYNMDNGLGNNSILGLYEDQIGNAWVMTDYGLSLIHLSLPYTILAQRVSEPYIGMAFDVCRNDDIIYIGTNQALYEYSLTEGRLSAAAETESQVWHISKIDNSIFIGDNSSTYVQSPQGVVKKYNHNSTDIKSANIHGRDVLVESSYYNLRIYSKDVYNNWSLSGTVSGFGAPVRQIEIDHDGAIWCSHIVSGVMRVELSPDLKTVADLQKIYIPRSDKNQSSTDFVMKLRGEVVISDGERLYTYNHRRKCLEPMIDIEADLPSIKGVNSITHINNNLFWLTSRLQYNLISYKDGHYNRLLTIPLHLFAMQSHTENNKVYVDSDGVSYFTINNGIGRVPSYTRCAEIPLPSMSLASVEYMSESGDIIRLPLNSNHRPSVAGNITFKFSFPNYNCVPATFCYEVEGSDRAPLFTSSPELSIVGLSFGDYVMRATLIDDNRREVAHISYSFMVSRPNYLSWWAISIYIFIFSIVAFLISKWNERRILVQRERDYQMAQASQNLKLMENERIISEQRTRLLESELSTKGKELASMALDIYSKQQVLDNLKDAIYDHLKKGKLETREVNALLRTVNSDIGDREFWIIFQKNFDLIHENFFRNLRKVYPDLTPTDLKFCALLRLNLSTKDIAKFTNLTVRGVETARYRLRRKFGIQDRTSLVQFLIDFKS